MAAEKPGVVGSETPLDFLMVVLDRCDSRAPALAALDSRQAAFADKPGEVLGAVARALGHRAEREWDGVGNLD